MRRRIVSEGKILKIILIVLVAVTAFGFIVMGLWNAVLVPVLHLGAINFWQALGILLLSKILFGGFKGRGHRGFRGGFGDDRRREMWEKFQNMSPEEKAEFKRDWKNKCRDWKRGNYERNNENKSAETNTMSAATE